MTITLPSPNAPATVLTPQGPSQQNPTDQASSQTPQAGVPLPNNSLPVMAQYQAAGGIPPHVALSQGFISANAAVGVNGQSLLALMSTGAVAANGAINVAPATVANPTNYYGA